VIVAVFKIISDTQTNKHKHIQDERYALPKEIKNP
jgi:hypothetical protein